MMNFIKKRIAIRTKVLVCVLALVFIFSTSNANASPQNLRLAGLTRYETAAEIAKQGWPSGASTAILAFGENFPDALVSTPLAKKNEAPILLTDKNYLTPVTKNTLISLGVQKVIIVGGYGAVSADVELQIKNLGITTARLYGSDRYETSVQIAKNVNSHPETLFVVTGCDFGDALSVASFAAKLNSPIILVDKDTLNLDVKRYISENWSNIKTTYVVGNSDVINEYIKDSFPNSARILGLDKYETNLAVINTFNPEHNPSRLFVSTGNGFADALAGSAFAAKNGDPIVLVNPDVSTLPVNLVSYLVKVKTSGKNTGVFTLGGEPAVPENLISSFQDFISLTPYRGSLVANKRQGQGKYTWQNGNAYDGHWADNEMNLMGTLTYINGDVFSGSYASNKREGWGTFKWENGDSYVGEWKNDQMNGLGTYTFSNGDEYFGNWSENKMNGFGQYTSPNGDSLSGYWKDNTFQY